MAKVLAWHKTATKCADCGFVGGERGEQKFIVYSGKCWKCQGLKGDNPYGGGVKERSEEDFGRGWDKE